MQISNAGDPSAIPGLGRSTAEGIGYLLQSSWASLVVQLVKNPPAIWETWVWSLGWEEPLEKQRAIHSSILAWRIPGSVSSMGSQRVRHSWVIFTFIFSGKDSTCQTRDMGSIPGSGWSPRGGNGTPLQYSCLGNTMDRGAWWATGGWYVSMELQGSQIQQQ